MTFLKSLAVLAFVMLGTSMANAQNCSGQFKPGQVCGNAGSTQAPPTPSSNPVLGHQGVVTGTLGLSGVTSGTVTLTPQAAAGTPTLTLPNTTGTVPSTALAPYTINLITGQIARTAPPILSPVDLATTGTSITLSGEQTIDGTLTSTSRVLVKDQTSAIQNGCYVTSAGPWSRCGDAAITGQIVQNTLVIASGGTTNKGNVYRLSGNTPTIGVSSIAFARKNPVTSILDFGGDPTGMTDSGAPCTAAVNSFDIHTGGILVFPPGGYGFSTPCVLPAFDANGGTGATPIVSIQMSGAHLFPSANNIAIIDRFPANQAEADNTISARYDIRGGDFLGTNPNTGIAYTGTTGIRLGASYSSYVNGTIFGFGFDIGLDFQFALNAKATNIRCTRINIYCVTAREGQWTGATTDNSQSNDTLFENVRDSSNNGQTASFYIHATDGVIIRNSVCEGGQPVQCILYDDDFSTTVKSFVVNGLHVESAGGVGSKIVTMKGGGGGVFTFQNVFNQTAQTFLDVTAFRGNGQTFNILDTGYTGAFLIPFKIAAGDTNKWFFRSWNTNTAATNPANWSTGIVPGGVLALASSNGPLINFSSALMGNPNATASYNFGIQLYGGYYFAVDDTFSIGTNTSGSVGALRPNTVSVGTGGINSAGAIISLAALQAYSGTAIPAGGTTGKGVLVSSASNFGVFFGSGAPTLTAARGSIYLRSDGVPYYNTDGFTAWTQIGVQALTSAHLFVGDGSNLATDVAASGDVSLVNTGAFTVTGLNGVGLGSTTATAGNVLIGSGTQWVTHAISGDGTLTSAGVFALANIPNATTMAGDIVATNSVAPSSPSAGHVALFADSTDLRFHDKNAAGTIGTTVVADTGAANNFLTAVSAAGVISKARPTCANLSDSSTGCSAAAGITALTGDVTATGPGSSAATVVNLPTGVTQAGSLVGTNIAAPSSPSSGHVTTWMDSTDLRMHDKNSAGTIATTVVADTGASNNFLTAISAAGVISKAQPAVSNLSGFGTGVATALGVNVGTAGSFVVNGGALGTPSSGTLSSATGLPISTGVSGLGTGVATALGTNVGSAGAFVTFNGALGTPSSGTLTSATGLPISTGLTGAGTGVLTALGTNVGSAGAFVTFNGALGTPSSGTLTSATGLPISTGISGLGTSVATALAVNLGTDGAVAKLVAHGAKALATGAIASATCTAAQTDTATGTQTTDAIIASFNGDPTAVTGYIPTTAGMLTIVPYPTADTVNFKVCNNTTGSITPGAVTVNWRVVR